MPAFSPFCGGKPEKGQSCFRTRDEPEACSLHTSSRPRGGKTWSWFQRSRGMGRMPKGPERMFVEEKYEDEVDVSLAACCLRMRLLGRKAIGCWKARGGCSSPRGLHTALLKCELGGFCKTRPQKILTLWPQPLGTGASLSVTARLWAGFTCGAGTGRKPAPAPGGGV